MRFEDIPQFTRFSGYACDHAWVYLPQHYANEVLNYGLDVNPDFQRGYVWTLEQKTRYVEYILKGGLSGRDLYFNCPGHHFGRVGRQYGFEGYYVLVDGKQRLDAALGFLNNEVPVFGGNYFRDFTDKLSFTDYRFRWHVNTLKTREEILQWYLDLNSGGTVHAPNELDRVRQLIGTPYEPPSQEIIIAQAGLDRDILKEAVAKIEIEKANRQKAFAENEAKRLAAAPPKKGKKIR